MLRAVVWQPTLYHLYHGRSVFDLCINHLNTGRINQPACSPTVTAAARRLCAAVGADWLIDWFGCVP